MNTTFGAEYLELADVAACGGQGYPMTGDPLYGFFIHEGRIIATF